MELLLIHLKNLDQLMNLLRLEKDKLVFLLLLIPVQLLLMLLNTLKKEELCLFFLLLKSMKG